MAGIIGALTVSFSTTAGAAPPVQRPTAAAPEPSVPEPPPSAEPSPPAVPEPASTPAPEAPGVVMPPVPPPEPVATAPAPDPGQTVDPMQNIERDHDETDETDEPVPSKATRSSQRVLRPTDKRSFFSMGVGGSSTGSYYGLGGMDFSWQALIGIHSRNRPTFGGGLLVAQRKGIYNEVTVAGRLVWDRPLSDSFAIYSSMNVDFGVNVMIGYASYLAPPFNPSALLGIGWGVDTILFERLKLGVRPISVNLVAPDFASNIMMRLRWDVMATIGVVW